MTVTTPVIHPRFYMRLKFWCGGPNPNIEVFAKMYSLSQIKHVFYSFFTPSSEQGTYYGMKQH